MDLPISSKYRSTPNEPVSEAERTQLSDQLNAAYTAGTIDQTTYSELLDQVFGAQKLGDLVGVVEVLGKPATHQVPAIIAEGRAEGRPGELAEANRPSRGATVALVGGIGVLAVIAVVVLLLLLL